MNWVFWVFGALFFVPVAIIAFLVMRMDLVLHFFRKREDDQAAEATTEATVQPPTGEQP